MKGKESGSVEEKAERLYNEVVTCCNSNLSKALVLVTRAILLVPSSVKYAIQRAEILCELGCHSDAITFLSKYEFTTSKIVAEKIRQLRSEFALFSSQTCEECVLQLLEWGNRNGIDTTNIRIVHYSKTFRGVHASRHIHKGQRILVIPESLILTIDKAKATCRLAEKVLSLRTELNHPLATAIACMIHDSKVNSKMQWQPYLNSLPEEADSFPYFFKPDELQYLNNTCLENILNEEKASMTEEYEHLSKKVSELANMGLENYLKYTTIASSRYFASKTAPWKRFAVPIADMFNCYPEEAGQTVWKYVAEERVFTVVALQEIPRGEIISINYGNKSNSAYLQYYGFVPMNNANVTVNITPEIDLEDPHLREKQQILCHKENEIFLYGREFSLNCALYFEENEKIMSAFRFIAYDGNMKDLHKYVDQTVKPELKYRKVRVPPLSIKNEIDALLLLKKFCMRILKRYPTSIEQDKALYNKKLSYNAKNALVVRIEEQKTFMEICKFAEYMINLLERKEVSMDKSIQEASWYRRYAENVVAKLVN